MDASWTAADSELFTELQKKRAAYEAQQKMHEREELLKTAPLTAILCYGYSIECGVLEDGTEFVTNDIVLVNVSPKDVFHGRDAIDKFWATHKKAIIRII
jgi:hypothetical protein